LAAGQLAAALSWSVARACIGRAIAPGNERTHRNHNLRRA
jgi:hypothetical protein